MKKQANRKLLKEIRLKKLPFEFALTEVAFCQCKRKLNLTDHKIGTGAHYK